MYVSLGTGIIKYPVCQKNIFSDEEDFYICGCVYQQNCHVHEKQKPLH